jgi:signal transduction histidine kinase
MDGTRTLFSYLWLSGYEHVTHGIPSSQAYGFQQYVDLAPREYILRFGVADQTGIMDGANWRSIRIIVPPYWYQRWWAYALLAAIAAGIIAFVAIREIVRLRREQELQQEFTKKQLEFQESERNRLASELHDGLGQSLLVIKNELRQILDEPVISREDLDRITALTDDTLETAREISSNLHPHHIEYLGFTAAVDALAQNIAQSSGVRMEFSCDTGDAVLPKEAEVHLYRIIQEGLSNIVRHAGARHVRVEMRKYQNSFEVIIRDDGRGFDVQEFERDHKRKTSSDPGRGFGLASMAERARIIGGMLTINSSTDSGTTIRLVLPAT